MSSPRKSKSPNKKYLIVDHDNSETYTFNSIGQVIEFLEETAEREGLNARDMDDQYQLFEIAREVSLEFEDRPGVEVIID